MEQAQEIKNYLQHRLSSEAKAAFERKLANNPSLQQELMIQRSIHEHVEEKIAEDTRAQVRAAIARVPARKRSRKFLWVLIALVLLLLGGAYLRRTMQTIQSQDLQEYAYVEATDFAMRGTLEDQIQSILTAQTDGDVELMKKRIDQLSPSYERKSEMILLLAKTYWDQGEHESAEVQYRLAAKDPQYIELAQLQILYFFAQTRQSEKYEALRSSITDLDSHTFSEELAQLEINRNHPVYKYFY